MNIAELPRLPYRTKGKKMVSGKNKIISTGVQIVPQLAFNSGSRCRMRLRYCLPSVLSVKASTTSATEKYHFCSDSFQAERIFLDSKSLILPKFLSGVLGYFCAVELGEGFVYPNEFTPPSNRDTWRHSLRASTFLFPITPQTAHHCAGDRTRENAP